MSEQPARRPTRLRRPMLLIVAMCSAIAFAGLPAISASATERHQPRDDRRPGFADGEWIGDMVAGFGFAFDGTTGGSDGGGVFSLSVDGGNIVAGRYEASAAGSFASSLGPGASGEGTLSASGTITGPADKPIIENVVARITGTITVGGVSVPLDQELGGGQMIMTILSATCSVVIGTAEPDTRAAVAGSVTITELSSRFVATRQAATPRERRDDFGIEVVSIIVAGDEVVADAADGSLDLTAFLDVLRRAERLAESIPRNTRCGSAGPGDHLSTAAAVVQSLLQLIIDNPAPFGATEIQVALEAAVRTGLAGPRGDPGLISDMRDVVGDKIAGAADAGDDIDVGRLGAAASMMGWAREAAAAAEYLGGGG